MIELVILLLVGAALLPVLLVGVGFVEWDRHARVHGAPEQWMVHLGTRLAAVGAVWLFTIWLLFVPAVVLAIGVTLVMVGSSEETAARQAMSEG